MPGELKLCMNMVLHERFINNFNFHIREHLYSQLLSSQTYYVALWEQKVAHLGQNYPKITNHIYFMLKQLIIKKFLSPLVSLLCLLWYYRKQEIGQKFSLALCVRMQRYSRVCPLTNFSRMHLFRQHIYLIFG